MATNTTSYGNPALAALISKRGVKQRHWNQYLPPLNIPSQFGNGEHEIKIPKYTFNDTMLYDDLRRANKAPIKEVEAGVFTYETASADEMAARIIKDGRDFEQRVIDTGSVAKAKSSFHEDAVAAVMMHIEKNAADLIQTTANYDSNNVETLSDGSRFDDDGTDPVEVIADNRNDVYNNCGIIPNLMVLDSTTLLKIQRNAKTKTYLADNVVQKVGLQMFKELFDSLETIVVVNGYYTTETGGTKTDLYSKFVANLVTDTNPNEPRFGNMFIVPTQHNKLSYEVKHHGKIHEFAATVFAKPAVVYDAAGGVIKSAWG